MSATVSGMSALTEIVCTLAFENSMTGTVLSVWPYASPNAIEIIPIAKTARRMVCVRGGGINFHIFL